MAGRANFDAGRTAAPLGRIAGATLAVPTAALVWIISAAGGASVQTALLRTAIAGLCVLWITSLAVRLLVVSVIDSWQAEKTKKTETETQ